MYCIWDRAQNKVVKVLNNLNVWIAWSSGDKTSPGQIGLENGNEILVNYVDNKPTVPPYHALGTSTETYDADTQTVTKNYTVVRAGNPTNQDVIDEAERRLFINLSSFRELFEMFMDWMELKEKIDSGGTLTTAEQNRLTEIRALWQRKKQVKQAAQAILQMDPIPDDFADDSRWP